MPLGFGGQRFLCPTRVGVGFGVADVDGPVGGKRKFFKHAAESPSGARLIPEGGGGDGVTLFPLPIIGGPKLGIAVATIFEEMKELGVGDQVFVDAEAR